MIKKQDLKQIDSLRKEIKYIEEKIKKIDSKPVQIVQDSVSASSASFPYTRHTAKIEGFENPKNNWPPNSPRTIAKKGSDVPLIDTGELRKSITHVIRRVK